MLLVINLSSKWKTFETPEGDVEYECALQTSRSSINVTANVYRVPTMRSEGKAGQKPETGRPVKTRTTVHQGKGRVGGNSGKTGNG